MRKLFRSDTSGPSLKREGIGAEVGGRMGERRGVGLVMAVGGTPLTSTAMVKS